MKTIELPLKGIPTIWQYFGNPNPVYYGLGIPGHNGIDFKAGHATPIYASHDGVANYEVDNLGGHGVVVRSTETYLYKGKETYMKTVYWHMIDSSKEPQFKSPIEDNQYSNVKTGDLLGYADSTGLSTGDHLHLSLKPIYLDDKGLWQNLEQGNPYKGAIDPYPFLPIIKYHFSTAMEHGDHNDQVNHLQHFLYQHGYMDLVPYDQQGIYGDRTAKAVLAFQKENCSLSVYERLVLAGTRVGTKTLEALNKF